MTVSHPQYIAHDITHVKLIVAHTNDGITTGKSRIIISRRLYSYETNYRDSVRRCGQSLYGSGSH